MDLLLSKLRRQKAQPRLPIRVSCSIHPFAIETCWAVSRFLGHFGTCRSGLGPRVDGMGLCTGYLEGGGQPLALKHVLRRRSASLRVESSPRDAAG